jgi:Holliday junction resolvasome RuvABC endonuclease subunit
MIVLGLDPGPAKTGWAIVNTEHRRPAFVEAGHDSNDYVCSRVALPVVDLVAIEWPGWTPIPQRNAEPATVRAMARTLIETALAAGEFAGLAAGHHKRVERLSSQDVRRAIVGKRNAPDKAVKAALLMQVDGMPDRTNVHKRDAIAVAIVGERAARGRP